MLPRMKYVCLLVKYVWAGSHSWSINELVLIINELFICDDEQMTLVSVKTCRLLSRWPTKTPPLNIIRGCLKKMIDVKVWPIIQRQPEPLNYVLVMLREQRSASNSCYRLLIATFCWSLINVTLLWLIKIFLSTARQN